MPDGTVYEEVWDEGQSVSRKMIEKAVAPKEIPVKPKKVRAQKFPNVMKEPRKPKIIQDGLSIITHLNVSQFINEKLLNKNINEWKTSDVGDWLDRGGFSQYKKNFEDNHITGKNLFDLTENDLNEEINIKDANHRKRIMKDLKFLKKIYTKNPDESEYIRNKLLKFYEKNQLFAKKSEIENKKDPVGLIAPVQINGALTSEVTAKRELKDINDRQDSLDVSQERKIDQSSSSSSSSSSNDEQNEATEKAVPVRKNQNVARKDEDDDSVAEPALHMSEYRTILHNYQQNDYDLLATIKRTLGKMVVIDYSEIEKGPSIGEGGYGEVFKGKWLGQDVAIKEFGRKRVRNKEKLDADFLREVEMVSKLRHPNIILFMGVSINPQGKGLLLTEFLEGGSLFDHLHKKSKKFDDNQIIDISLDIALGMNYLHGQKILHCDLKSSNILLDERFNVKLGDFGLSKTKRKFHGRKNFKRVGTPHWMAPEIMREEEYDEYSDVYSYGMILWELMVRKVPYYGLKINQIVGSVGYGDKQVPIPETGNEIMRILMKKCLNKDRKKRPSFKQIADFLKESDKHRKTIAMRELDSFFN